MSLKKKYMYIGLVTLVCLVCSFMGMKFMAATTEVSTMNSETISEKVSSRNSETIGSSQDSTEDTNYVFEENHQKDSGIAENFNELDKNEPSIYPEKLLKTPRLSGNVISGVTISTVKTYKLTTGDGSNESDWTEITGGETIVRGDKMKFSAEWFIDSPGMLGVSPDDYFDIELPSAYFYFNSSKKIPLKTSEGEIIGDFQLIASEGSEVAKIRVSLNETGVEKQNIKDGFVYAIGSATENKDKDKEILVGEKPLPPFEIEDPPSTEIVPLPTDNKIMKGGWQSWNENSIAWNFVINSEAIRKVYQNDLGSITKMNNVILTDEMPKGLTYSRIRWNAPLYMPTTSGDVGNRHFLGNTLSDTQNPGSFPINLNKIEPALGDSWDTFQTKVAAQPAPCYGIFPTTDINTSGDKIVINIGNLPDDGNLNAGPKELFLGKIDYYFDNGIISDAGRPINSYEANKLKQVVENLFDVSVTGHVNYEIELTVDVNPDVIEDGSEIENKAKLKWDEGEETSNLSTVKFIEVGGGAEVSEPGSVKITKKENEASGQLLKGAKFKLQKWNDVTKVFEDMTSMIDGGPIERETNDSGEVLFEKLDIGKYKVVETQAPSGYDDMIEFEGGVDTFEVTGSDSKGSVVVAYNFKSLGKVELYKVEKDTGAYLKDAEFIFYRENSGINEYYVTDGINVSWSTDKEDASKLKTDAAGKIKISELEVGDYYFQEVSAPKGHKLDVSTKKVTLTKENIAKGEVAKIQIENDLSEVRIKKVDSNTNTPLPNADFVLYDSSDQVLDESFEPGGSKKIYTTDSNGEIVLKGIPDGNYYLLEEKAPNGYVKIEGKIEFEVKDGYLVNDNELVIKNTREGHLPKTGSNQLKSLYFIAFSSIVFGSTCLSIRTFNSRRRIR